MRVLFTLTPARGSLEPLLAVAEGLGAAHHEVAFCSAPSMAGEVERLGYRFFAAGVDWHASDPRYIQVLCDAAGGLSFPPLTGQERFAWVTDHLFIGGSARRMLPDLVRTVDEWRPDLVVRESLEFAGCVAAERAGLPHASIAAAADSALDMRQRLAHPLARLRADVGLPPDRDAGMPYRYLHLCFSPPRFDGPGAVFPPVAHFLRHATRGRPSEAAPGWLEDLPARPRVLVSMGTVFHRTPGLYEAIVGGLQDLPVCLLMALGYDQDPARLGSLPAHVRVEPWLPIPLLLPTADLLVTHGGFNSVKEALSVGVPLVVIPIAGDQPYSGQRCAALGVGEVVPPDERTPDRIRAAARTVLGDDGYRRQAREFEHEMEALPGIDHAVHLLETLAAEARPAAGAVVPTRWP